MHRNDDDGRAVLEILLVCAGLEDKNNDDDMLCSQYNDPFLGEHGQMHMATRSDRLSKS